MSFFSNNFASAVKAIEPGGLYQGSVTSMALVRESKLESFLAVGECDINFRGLYCAIPGT